MMTATCRTRRHPHAGAASARDRSRAGDHFTLVSAAGRATGFLHSMQDPLPEGLLQHRAELRLAAVDVPEARQVPRDLPRELLHVARADRGETEPAVVRRFELHPARVGLPRLEERPAALVGHRVGDRRLADRLEPRTRLRGTVTPRGRCRRFRAAVRLQSSRVPTSPRLVSSIDPPSS
jgi:hypothetical protein